MNVFNWVGDTLQRATHRNARAHLLIVLMSTLSSHVQRMMAVNGSAVFMQWKVREFKGFPQKLVGFSSHFIVRDRFENSR
jgi:hypothetical protein